jgi:hypothetical protein
MTWARLAARAGTDHRNDVEDIPTAVQGSHVRMRFRSGS